MAAVQGAGGASATRHHHWRRVEARAAVNSETEGWLDLPLSSLPLPPEMAFPRPANTNSSQQNSNTNQNFLRIPNLPFSRFLLPLLFSPARTFDDDLQDQTTRNKHSTNTKSVHSLLQIIDLSFSGCSSPWLLLQMAELPWTRWRLWTWGYAGCR